jgi:hypothetical protein
MYVYELQLDRGSGKDVRTKQALDEHPRVGEVLSVRGADWLVTQVNKTRRQALCQPVDVSTDC